MYRSLFIALVAGIMFQASVAISAGPAVHGPAAYKIDPSHTRVLYFISHLGFSKMPGQFNDINGTILFDPDDVSTARIDAVINAKSVSMGHEVLDKKLQGPDYFNTGKYPEIRFVSTSVQKTGETRGKITGNLPLLGVTRPVTLNVKLNRHGPNPYAKSDAIGFSAWGKIRRSDFGMKILLPDVGDEISLRIEAEAQGGSPASSTAAPVVPRSAR